MLKTGVRAFRKSNWRGEGYHIPCQFACCRSVLLCKAMNCRLFRATVPHHSPRCYPARPGSQYGSRATGLGGWRRTQNGCDRNAPISFFAILPLGSPTYSTSGVFLLAFSLSCNPFLHNRYYSSRKQNKKRRQCLLLRHYFAHLSSTKRAELWSRTISQEPVHQPTSTADPLRKGAGESEEKKKAGSNNKPDWESHLRPISKPDRHRKRRSRLRRRDSG